MIKRPDSNVVYLSNVTQLDLPADRILERASGQLEGVVIIGFTKDGDEYFASSYADGGTVLWLMERFKAALVKISPEDVEEAKR